MNIRFEYKTIIIEPDSIWSSNVEVEKIDQILNQYGLQGWELANMYYYPPGSLKLGAQVTFKRKIL